MRCRTVRWKLDGYAAEALTPALRRKVAAHLEVCPACRRELARLRELTTLLASAPAPPPVPDGLAGRLVARARERLDARQQPAPASAIPWRWWTSASVPMRFAAAAVLAISLSLGALMGRGVARGVAAPSQSAQADPAAVYNLDFLAEAPSGSLADAYLTLASARTEEGE